ncbi:MAG: hypothetical protein K1X72_16910 [Pyrinomonadaceae bacterium]|nr:hypothetical protein [Pyrinomonadaceae bacterium]
MEQALNAIAATSVVGVLLGHGVSNMSGFTFEGYSFSPSVLSLMAYEIRDGRMGVTYSSKIGTKAIYNSTENNLYLGFLNASSESRRALVVHEVTHAVCDFQAKKMDVAQSESIAYIAQCLYARANSTSNDPDARLYSDDEAKDKVFEIGWRIAGKIIDGGAVDSGDCVDMRAAVKGHPYYASNASSSAGYDGY